VIEPDSVADLAPLRKGGSQRFGTGRMATTPQRSESRGPATSALGVETEGGVECLHGGFDLVGRNDAREANRGG
jgi:hypothetical protein